MKRLSSDFSIHDRINRPALNSSLSGWHSCTSVIIRELPTSSRCRLPISRPAFNLILRLLDDKSTNLPVKVTSFFWTAVITTGSSDLILLDVWDSDICFMSPFCESGGGTAIDLEG